MKHPTIEIDFYRDVVNTDGSTERWVPALNKHGQYVLADTSVHPQRNLKENQVFLESAEGVAARLKQGWAMRMKSESGKTPGNNLIAGASITQRTR